MKFKILIFIVLALFLANCNRFFTKVDLNESNLPNPTYLPDSMILQHKNIIFTDLSKKSKYYNRIKDSFSFYEFDELLYNYYGFDKIKNINSQNNFDKLNLNKTWIKLYNKNDKYYLYYNCNGGFEQTFLCDSFFFTTGYDSGFLKNIKSIEEIEKNKKYRINFEEELSYESVFEKSIDLEIIDKKTMATIFTINLNEFSFDIGLYIPVENAKKYNLIVNYCPNQLDLEYDFDSIPIKLIKDKKVKITN